MAGYPCCCENGHSYKWLDYLDFNNRCRIAEMDSTATGHLLIWRGQVSSGSTAMGQHVEPLIAGAEQDYTCHAAYYENYDHDGDGHTLRQYARGLGYGTNIEMIWDADPPTVSYIDGLDETQTADLDYCWKQCNGLFCITSEWVPEQMGTVFPGPWIQVRDFATGEVVNSGGFMRELPNAGPGIVSILPLSANLVSILYCVSTNIGGPVEYRTHAILEWDAAELDGRGAWVAAEGLSATEATETTGLFEDCPDPWQASLTLDSLSQLYYSQGFTEAQWYKQGDLSPIAREQMECGMWGFTSIHCEKLYAVRSTWVAGPPDVVPCVDSPRDYVGACAYRDSAQPTECDTTFDELICGPNDVDDSNGYITRQGENWGATGPQMWAYVVRDSVDENGDDTSEDCLAGCGDIDAELPAECEACECPDVELTVYACAVDGCWEIMVECPVLCDDNLTMDLWKVDGDCEVEIGPPLTAGCDPTPSCGTWLNCCAVEEGDSIMVRIHDDCYCWAFWCGVLGIDTEACPASENCDCCLTDPTNVEITITGVGWATADHCYPCTDIDGAYDLAITVTAACTYGNAGEDFTLPANSCATPTDSTLTIYATFQLFDCGTAGVNYLATIGFQARYNPGNISTATYTKSGTMPEGVLNCLGYASGEYTRDSQSGTCDWPATLDAVWT